MDTSSLFFILLIRWRAHCTLSWVCLCFTNPVWSVSTYYTPFHPCQGGLSLFLLRHLDSRVNTWRKQIEFKPCILLCISRFILYVVGIIGYKAAIVTGMYVWMCACMFVDLVFLTLGPLPPTERHLYTAATRWSFTQTSPTLQSLTCTSADKLSAHLI